MNKSTIFTYILASLGSIIALIVQLRAENNLTKCSYLDPIIVDILATAGALFLIIEGFYKIDLSNGSIKDNLTRSLRVALGAAILTLHIMHFMHK